MAAPSTPRRGESLPADHPLTGLIVAGESRDDCISHIAPELLDEVAAYHDDDEPPDAEVDPEELV
jgi:hypothetical protein